MKNLILLNRLGFTPDLTTRQSRVDSVSIASRCRVLATLLLCLTVGLGQMWAAEVVYKTAKFGTQANSGKSSDYTSTWTSTYNEFAVDVTNGNTNGTNWDHVRFGRNATASVGQIVTKAAIDKKVTKVTLTINAVNTTGTNSIKLYTSINGSSWTERGSFTLSTGAQTVSIDAGNQATNLYYKIELNCNNKVKSNGFDQIAQVDYYYDNSSGSTCATPTFSPAAGVYTESQTVTITSATAGATIYYTTDGNTPTTSSLVYSTPLSVSSTTTIKAIAVKADLANSEVGEAAYTINIPYTVSFSTGTGNPTQADIPEASVGAGITLPAGPTPACSSDGWVFAGWGKTEVNDVTVAPRLYMPGDMYYPESDETLYAVYRKLTSGTSTATFTASDCSNLTLISSDIHRPAWWVHTATGVELYIEDYGIFSNTFDIDNTINNGDGWAIIDAHSKIASIALTVSSGYAVDDIDTDAGSAELSGSGTSQTITCSGDVTQIYLYAADNGESRITTFTITYYNAKFDSNPVCCDKDVTLAHNSPSNGTVTFSPAGPIATCSETASDRQATMTITPNTGYYLSAFNWSTGAGTITPGVSPAISTSSATGAQAITLSYNQDVNGTSTFNATFTAKDVTDWTWKQENPGPEEITIPATVNLYVGQQAWFDLKGYTPSDVINEKKGYSATYSNTYLAQDGKGNTQYKTRAKAVIASTTLTFTSTSNGSVTQEITISISALPSVTFIDLIHGESFSAVSANVDDSDNRIVHTTKPTPTHSDVADPGEGYNACERNHLHLVGWIDKAWVDDGHQQATHSEISSAGAGNFYAPGADMDLVAKNGKTFYAVWAKEGE